MSSIASATGYSGLFTGIHGQSDIGTIGVRTSAEGQISKALRSIGDRKSRAVLYALIGAVAGGTATATYSQIEALRDTTGNPQGGKRNVLTRTLVNRVTAAADVTDLKAVLDDRYRPLTYPTDKSGNGGGGKGGF